MLTFKKNKCMNTLNSLLSLKRISIPITCNKRVVTKKKPHLKFPLIAKPIKISQFMPSKTQLQCFNKQIIHKKIKKHNHSTTGEQFSKLINDGLVLANEIQKISFEYVNNNYAKKLGEFVEKQMVKIGYSNVEDIIHEVKTTKGIPSLTNIQSSQHLKASHTPINKNRSNCNVERTFSASGNVASSFSHKTDEGLSTFGKHWVKFKHENLDNYIKTVTIKHSLKNDFLNSITSSNISKARRILNRNPEFVHDNFSVY